MRDLLILAIVIPGCLLALRKPWVGVMVWTWLSIMNPHAYAFGVVSSLPLAGAVAGCTVLGLFFDSEKESPFKGKPVAFLILFMIWMTLSWILGLDVEGDYPQWKKVMKIDFMILITLMCLRNKAHIYALAWVATGSLAILGAKGGLFTLLHGGNYLVWGPPGSFIEDNNEFALALVMTIPLLRFLQLQLKNNIGRHLITAAMILCAVSVLGTHSRGGLLAIASMTLFLWWRGKNKLGIGIAIIFVGVALLAFMPESWFARMGTISNYEEDRSAMGRISAWWAAWNLACHFPLGVGFNPATPDLFAIYSPYPEFVHAAHSIYFQILGNHGFIGLGLFLLIWWTTWNSANWLREKTPKKPETQWCIQLASMVQVSLIGYFVGGMFLSLGYFDLPYNLMVLVVLTRAWIAKQSWESEYLDDSLFRFVPGLAKKSSVQQ